MLSDKHRGGKGAAGLSPDCTLAVTPCIAQWDLRWLLLLISFLHKWLHREGKMGLLAKYPSCPYVSKKEERMVILCYSLYHPQRTGRLIVFSAENFVWIEKVFLKNLLLFVEQTQMAVVQYFGFLHHRVLNFCNKLEVWYVQQ